VSRHDDVSGSGGEWSTSHFVIRVQFGVQYDNAIYKRGSF